MEYDFDLSDRLLYQVYYVSKGGSADFAFFMGVLTAKYGDMIIDKEDSGKYSLLYDQLGRDDGHIGVAHWLVTDQKLGIDLWYNDSDTVFTVFYDMSNPASYGEVARYYTDDTGISFAYMDGWDASAFNFPPQMMGFVHRRDTKSSVQYIRLDLWEDLKEYYEPMGFNRRDVGPAFLDDDMVSILMGTIIPQNLRTRRHNGVSYKVFEHQTDNNGKSEEVYYCTIEMTVREGYLHMFQLSSVSRHDELLPDFEKLMDTVTFER